MSTELSPAELIERHQNGVWRYLRMLGCDAATADDLTQETFLKVLRREHFVQYSDDATSEYLRRTAHNLLVSSHRKMSRVHLSDSVAVLDQAWAKWAGKDLAGNDAIDALAACMKLLTDRAKHALHLRFVDNVPRIEIGKTLGISDHGARNLMQRAKAQLRECVAERLKVQSTIT